MDKIPLTLQTGALNGSARPPRTGLLRLDQHRPGVYIAGEDAYAYAAYLRAAIGAIRNICPESTFWQDLEDLQALLDSDVLYPSGAADKQALHAIVGNGVVDQHREAPC